MRMELAIMATKRKLKTLRGGDKVKLANGDKIEILSGRVKVVIEADQHPEIDFAASRKPNIRLTDEPKSD